MGSDYEPHTAEELRLASDYLEYHVNMLVSTLLWLRAGSTESLEKNAVLDSSLIHWRLLKEFLCSTWKMKGEDLRASEFFHDSPAEASYEPQSTKELDDFADKVSKRLVHLTTGPMPDLISQQEWDPWSVAGPILDRLSEFLDKAPSDRVDSHHVEMCRKHIARFRYALKSRASASEAPSSGFTHDT